MTHKRAVLFILTLASFPVIAFSVAIKVLVQVCAIGWEAGEDFLEWLSEE